MPDNLPTILSEISEIEHTIAVNRRLYNDDAAMQARYRGLIEQRDGGTSTMLHEASDEALIPMLSPGEFSRQAPGGDYGGYIRLVRSLSDWAFSMPAAEQRKFVQAFDDLPEEVGVACVAEIMSHPPSIPHTGYASPRGLDEFRKLPEGAVLVKEWGGLSARNLAVVRERLFRTMERMPERHWPSFCRWLDGLSTGCAIALYRRLAS